MFLKFKPANLSVQPGFVCGYSKTLVLNNPVVYWLSIQRVHGARMETVEPFVFARQAGAFRTSHT
ncbi:MAG: hypothetical protein QOJ99_5891 [Bryobacterales bacterium]|jgi:hypothetical protein|nr:hypothetical protein [Bryobacterales bacterium]